MAGHGFTREGNSSSLLKTGGKLVVGWIGVKYSANQSQMSD